MSLSKYSLRLAQPGQDRETVLALWRQAFTQTEKHPVKFDWCYAGTSPGNGRLYLLEGEEPAQIIGVQGIVPRRWWLRGREVDAGICADLVVHPQYRSIGPALNLVTAAIEREQHAALQLLYGFPNRRTEALYRRKAYPRLPGITRYAKPLHSRVWLRRKGIPDVLASVVGGLIDRLARLRQRLHGLHDAGVGKLVPVSGFDARFDALWARVRQSTGPMGVRDSAFLRWRFDNNFVGKTHIMVLETQEGRIDGYVVYVVGQAGLVSVLDFLASDNSRVLPVMLRQFLLAMQKQGINGISLEFSGPAAVDHCLRQLGFSVRETHPVYLLLGQAALSTDESASVYLTTGDRDQ